MSLDSINSNLIYSNHIQERNSIGPLFDTLPIEIVLIILYTLDTRSYGRLALTNWKWSQIIAHECKIEDAYRSKLEIFDASSWYKISKSMDLQLSITDEPMISRQDMDAFFKESLPISQMQEEQKIWLITIPKGIDTLICDKLYFFKDIILNPLTDSYEKLKRTKKLDDGKIDRTYRIFMSNQILKTTCHMQIDQMKVHLTSIGAQIPSLIEGLIFFFASIAGKRSTQFKESQEHLPNKSLLTVCLGSATGINSLCIGWMQNAFTVYIVDHSEEGVLPVWRVQADRTLN